MNKEQKDQNDTVDENVVETILENDQEQINETNLDVDSESNSDEKKVVEIDYKDKYLRLLAEQDNLHKQLTKEKSQSVASMKEKLLKDILEPVDNMQMALSHSENSSAEVKNWAIGFKMILNQIKDVLSTHDAHPFEALNEPFNPLKHEAVDMIETTEFKPNRVVKVHSNGYMIKDRVLRPARVSVSKEIKNKNNTKET